MKFVQLLAVVPFLALTYLPAAHAEDASVLPWNNFIRESTGPQAGAKLLATLHIGSRIEIFSAPVPECASKVRAVELKVQGADVTVQSFGIKFTDGNTKDFTVNKTYKAGTDSGWIDLGMFRMMDQRCPAEIYAKANSTGNATVLVYGDMK
ncbi:MAG: DUF2541 family protein [Bdellovibrionota bacterium]